MIKVLQVVPLLAYGGVEKVVRNYYDVLEKDVYHFDFVTHGGVEDYHQSLQDDGSRIFYFQTIGKLGIRGYEKQIQSQINVSEYDIIHIHIGDVTGLYAYTFRICGAKNIICHAHTTQAVGSSRNFFKPKVFLRFLANKVSDYRFACGVDAGDYCFGKGKYTLLPNAIDFDKFNNVSNNQIDALRKEFALKDGYKVIGHVGAFIDQKNHLFLLDVFAELLKQRSNVYLMLIGDGKQRPLIEEKIQTLQLEENVILCGIRKDVNVFMKLFDLFVFPSLFEGVPVVGVEAQTAGLRCLFSDQIDQRLDIGCGLVSFLPIDNGVCRWSEAITEQLDSNTVVKNSDIKAALFKNGLSLDYSVSILKKAYMDLV